MGQSAGSGCRAQPSLPPCASKLGKMVKGHGKGKKSSHQAHGLLQSSHRHRNANEAPAGILASQWHLPAQLQILQTFPLLHTEVREKKQKNSKTCTPGGRFCLMLDDFCILRNSQAPVPALRPPLGRSPSGKASAAAAAPQSTTPSVGRVGIRRAFFL